MRREVGPLQGIRIAWIIHLWLKYENLHEILMTGLYSQILQIAFEKGYSEKDTVAFYEIMRGMAGLEERQGVDEVPFGKDTKL